MNNHTQYGGKFVTYHFTDREITKQISGGGFEPNERADVTEMAIGGYLPESLSENPCFEYSINGDETGFEWYWGDMPQSIHTKLWREAMPPASKAASTLGSRGGKSTSDAKRKASAENGKLGGRPKKTE